MQLEANLVNTKWCKKPEKWRKPWQMVLIRECSARAFQWIPRWQGLDGLQHFLYFFPMDERSLSMERVKPYGCTHALLELNLVKTNVCKTPEKWRDHEKLVLIWECSARAFRWIPTWQGLDGFQNLLHFSPMNESGLSMERLKPYGFTHALLELNLINRKWCKKPENYGNHGKWVLIWECSARAF